MTSLAQTADRSRILASSTDRFVAVYDPREAPSLEGPPPLLSHPALPSSVSTHPTDSNKAITGAYDGIVRIWDLRSTKSAITAFEVTGGNRESRKNAHPADRKKKIMSVDWGYKIIGVAGESGVEVWRTNDQEEAVQ
jgi:ribosome biogenesis protein YTM1